MKMVRYTLSLLFILSFLAGCTPTKQASEPFICELMDTPLKDFRVDLFGNLYTIDMKNRLKVFDPDFNLLFEYYNNILGDISHIDITNPKKIIIFFGGFQKMIFLDDALYELGRYEGDLNILAMGSSRDNNIWIYDGLDYRLKKISNNNEVLLESNPVESYLEIDILPDYIVEYENMVYLVEEGKGVVVFDNFGTYSDYIPVAATSVKFANQSMYYTKDGSLYQKVIDNKFAEERKIKTVPTGVETVYLYKNNIFYLDDRCLTKMAVD